MNNFAYTEEKAILCKENKANNYVKALIFVIGC